MPSSQLDYSRAVGRSGILAISLLAVALLFSSCSTTPSHLPPPTVVLDAATLSQIKDRIRTGEVEADRVDTLNAVADEQLAMPPVSVMHKKLLPPSGDRHDYLTRAPYFWPNPETDDGLPYLKRDGQIYEENRSGTDLYARQQLDRKVITLALAYFLTNDDRYAEGAAEQLRVWFLDPETRMNPHLEYSQGVPGIMNGSEWGSIDNWQWPALLDAARLIRPSNYWTVDDDTRLQDWFGEYGLWLESSMLGGRYDLMWNNHGSFYDAQRASIAVFTGDTAKARQIVESAWHRRIDHGIESDGRQPYELERTRGFGYSLFNLRSYFTLAAIGQSVGVDLWNRTAEDGSGIRRALDYLAPYADPAKQWPNDDLKFDQMDLLPMLHWASIAYDDDAYRNSLMLISGYEETRGARTRRSSDLFHLFLDP